MSKRAADLARGARPGRSTEERIVDAAIVLFNESGIAAVTTNHVAGEAGLSPVNQNDSEPVGL